MRFTALSVRGWRRIGMGVRRSLIWGVVARICFIRRRILGIIEQQGADEGLLIWGILRCWDRERNKISGPQAVAQEGRSCMSASGWEAACASSIDRDIVRE